RTSPCTSPRSRRTRTGSWSCATTSRGGDERKSARVPEGRRRFAYAGGRGGRFSAGSGLFRRLARLIEQLHQRHRRRVARPVAHLQDPEIPARTILEARPELVEELADRRVVAQPIEREAPTADAVLLRKRDQRLDDAPQLLRLRQRGLDRLVRQQRCRHVAVHRLAMRGVPAELAARFTMTHCPSLSTPTTRNSPRCAARAAASSRAACRARGRAPRALP